MLTAQLGAVAVSKKPGPESDFQISGTWEQRPAYIAGKFRWTDQELRVIVEPELLGSKARIEYAVPIAQGGVPQLGIDAQLIDLNLLLETLSSSDSSDPSSDADQTATVFEPPKFPDVELQGLIDKLTRDEILDLIAYITARGREDSPLFHGGEHHHGAGH